MPLSLASLFFFLLSSQDWELNIGYSSCVVAALPLGLLVAVHLKELWHRLMLQP